MRQGEGERERGGEVERTQGRIGVEKRERLCFILSYCYLTSSHFSVDNWMDAAYEETFHWHSGKPLDGYNAFLSGVCIPSSSPSLSLPCALYLFSSPLPLSPSPPLPFLTQYLQYDDQRSTATFYWHYGRSLEISLKPPETNEFSQHLRIQIQIQPQRFVESNSDSKKAKVSKTKAKPGSKSAKTAKTATSAQWKVLISNSANMLAKPRGEYV